MFFQKKTSLSRKAPAAEYKEGREIDAAGAGK